MAVQRDPSEQADRRRSTPDAEAETPHVQLARVMAQFPGAVAVYAGPQHVFRAASAAYRAFIGGREVVGLPIREALPELDGQGFFELLDQVYRTGKPVSVSDVPARWDSDGDGVPEFHRIDFIYQPLIAADGEVEGVVAFVQDVTQRHVALAALAASEARYRLAVDAAQLGTWAWDVETDVATFDDRVRELLGLSDANARSRASIIESRVHPDDRERLNAALMRAADPAGDGRFQGEYRIVHEDGTERWALAFARMHFTEVEARRAVQLVGTVLDITDQKRSEARQQLLARLGADLLVAGDERVALQQIADAAVMGLADWAIVDVIEGDGLPHRAAMAHVDPAKLDVMRELAERYPPDPSRPTLGRQALATGRAQLFDRIDDAMIGAIAHDAEQARLGRAMGMRSAIAVPLQTREGPFGIAAFGSGCRSFTLDDLSVAEEIGRRASLAVENARLIAAAKRARDEAERAASRTARLQALSAALAAALTPNDAETTAVREAIAAIGADAGLIVLLSPDGTMLEVMESRGYDQAQVEQWRRFPLDLDVPLAEAVRTGQPVIVSTPEERDHQYPVIATSSLAIRYPASISVPLIAEGRSFGALGLSFGAPLEVTAEDKELLLAVARQCAQAVRRAVLFDAEAVARASAEAAGKRLAFLADASAAVASLDYEATLQRVAQLAVPSFADYVIIDLLDDAGDIHRVASAHADPAKASLLQQTTRFYPSAGHDRHPFREPLAKGEPVLVAKVDEAWLGRLARDPEHLAVVRALEPESAIMAPLSARRHTLGLMTFVRSGSGRQFNSADVSLAGEVARRAAVAVDNARLYRQSEIARHEAEAASRAKGQFLAVMSHELRTPLNAILGYSELVEMGVHGAVTDAQREAMARIRRSGQHLLSLVNNVLNLERSEVGGLEADFATLPVAQLFEDADALTRPQAEAKEITLSVDTPPPSLSVLGEREKAGQVLANLLSNAVKFTPKGGRISLTHRANGEMVELRVTDTGLGIPAESLERIFEPFVQLDSGLTRRAEGAGLGLAISRRLARLRGGDLTAESVVGQGSTFTLMLVRVE
jgi:PAS domain S-box-containing protein